VVGQNQPTDLAAAQWPVGDEVDGTSNRGSRGGRRARGGGDRAYRVAVRREVGVEAARQRKSGGGWGRPVLGVGQSRSGEEGEVAVLSEVHERARQGAAVVERRKEKGRGEVGVRPHAVGQQWATGWHRNKGG
jgi:hypothetical protein